MRSKRVLLLIFCLLLVLPVSGQFGGRPGDVVIFALTSKGPMDFQIASGPNPPPTTPRFEVIDPGQIPLSPFGAGFPEGLFSTQNLHLESDDTFRLLTMHEDHPTGGTHRIYQATIKSFILDGFIRETASQLDFPTANYSPLVKGIDFGPDKALGLVKILVWSADFRDPLVVTVPLGVTGPVVPPGMTGIEYAVSIAKTPLFIPWASMRQVYPNAGWQQGIDIKTVDADPAYGNTTRFIRLRPGRATPSFRIPGATHFFILQGSVDIVPAGAAAIRMKQSQYAFIPRNFVFKLSNPREFNGPVSR